MDKSALDAAIAALERVQAVRESWVLLFAVLVAVGVTGEAVLGIRQWFTGRELRELRVEADRRHSVALEQLRKEAAEATAKAEQEQLKRVQLQKLLEIRSLSLEQHQALTETLSQFAGQAITLVRTDFSNEIRFATMVLDVVLNEAGWKTVIVDKPWRAPLFGLLIEVSESEEAEKAAKALALGLNDAHWEAYGPTKMIEPVIPIEPEKRLVPPPPLQLIIGENRYMER